MYKHSWSTTFAVLSSTIFLTFPVSASSINSSVVNLHLRFIVYFLSWNSVFGVPYDYQVLQFPKSRNWKPLLNSQFPTPYTHNLIYLSSQLFSNDYSSNHTFTNAKMNVATISLTEMTTGKNTINHETVMMCISFKMIRMIWNIHHNLSINFPPTYLFPARAIVMRGIEPRITYNQ